MNNPLDYESNDTGAKIIFPKIVVQRCIVHLIRNSIKYITSKNYKNSNNH